MVESPTTGQPLAARLLHFWGRMRRRWVVLALLGAGIAGSWLLLLPRHVVLEITPIDTGRPVFCAKMRVGEEVVLSFTHSVNRRPVYDTIRIARDRVIVVKSRFDAFGAGMPEHSTDEGTFRVAEDGWIEWTINRPMPEVVVRIGRVAHHTLRLKGRDVALATLAPPGTAVALRPSGYAELDLWKGRCLR
jgi:hypothetical protein